MIPEKVAEGEGIENPTDVASMMEKRNIGQFVADLNFHLELKISSSTSGPQVERKPYKNESL